MEQVLTFKSQPISVEILNAYKLLFLTYDSTQGSKKNIVFYSYFLRNFIKFLMFTKSSNKFGEFLKLSEIF